MREACGRIDMRARAVMYTRISKEHIYSGGATGIGGAVRGATP
jgi:hypothetical protein